MLVIRFLIILASVQFIASSIVHCKSSYRKRRKVPLKALHGKGSAFLLTSVDSNTLEESNNRKTSNNSDETSLLKLITENVSVPIFAVNFKSRVSRFYDVTDFFAVSTKEVLRAGPFKFEEKISYWRNHKDVYVYYGEKTSSRYHFFEACRMTSPDVKGIKIEKSAVLMIQSRINDKEDFLESLKQEKENLSMVNFKTEEFEVQGLEICDYVELYMNECVEKSKNSPDKLVHFVGVLIIFAVIMIAIFSLEVIMKIRSPNRVVPFTRE
jgi:hypothetical protein